MPNLGASSAICRRVLCHSAASGSLTSGSMSLAMVPVSV